MLTPGAYPESGPIVPATPYAFGETTLRAQLRARLARQFPTKPAKVTFGLNVFSDPAIIRVMPDPRLRMALGLLTGKLSQGTIGVIRNGIYNSIGFGTPPELGAVAQVVCDTEGGNIIFNEIYEYEDPRFLAVSLAHEALHRCDENYYTEEMINSVIEDLTYMQFLLDDSSLSRKKGALARSQNVTLMAMINTRDSTGAIRLKNGLGPIFPGSPHSLSSYMQLFSGSSNFGFPSPGNGLLVAEVRRITKLPTISASFDLSTIDLLDQNLNLFSALQWIRIANALKLDLNSHLHVASQTPQGLAPSPGRLVDFLSQPVDFSGSFIGPHSRAHAKGNPTKDALFGFIH